MDCFNLFERLHILVVGDLMLDTYTHGTVTRISPEAPVPIVDFQREEHRPGGAANVAMNIKAMGAVCTLCGVIGSDSAADMFRDTLSAAGLSDRAVLSIPRRMTTVKTRILAGHQQLLRLDRERKDPLESNDNTLWLERIRHILSEEHPDALILQDYDKGLFTPASINAILDMAAEHAVPVAVDPKFENFWHYRGATLFKPNLKEVSDALRWRPSADKLSDLQFAAHTLHQKLGNRYTLITLAEKGLFMSDHVSEEKEAGKMFPTRKRAVRDVCGAGDTVIGVATLALAAGMDAPDIALLANLSGGQVVEHIGAVPVDRSILAAEYTQEKLVGADASFRA